MRPAFTIVALIALCLLASPAAASSLPRASDDAQSLPAIEPTATLINPPEITREPGVADGALREAIALEQLGADDETIVEVVHDLQPNTARKLVSRAGGNFLADAPGGITEAVVPFDEIAALEATPGVRYVRQPLRASVPTDVSPLLFIGDEIAETNADAWHAAGYFGAGVKVGIIDFFDVTAWNDAQNAGEVPAPAGTFCRLFGSPCSVFDPGLGDPHGVAVAEIIHEMAPQAQIYIAFAYTTADTQAAVNYFAGEGVDIISRSLTSTYDGPGDGTGPLAEVVDSAVEQGMVWVNSAGNSASSSGTSNGSYWRGSWTDTNANGFIEFAPGDEVFEFYCGFLNGLRWNDWGANATDYDVYIFNTPTDVNNFTPKYSSINDQTSGFDPLEIIDDGPSCSGGSDIDHLVIHLWDAGGGTAGDNLEIMGNQTTFEYSQNPYSASGPASDSANPGMISVGAMSGTGPSIASYSSQGPTNDGRIKPDLAASSCVDSYTYQPGCFAGTSASAPGVAGAAALVIGSGVATDPAAVRSWLIANATVERGVAGPDNIYGAGELIFSPPPPDTDADAKADSGDNCPNWPNPTQALPPWPVAANDPDCDGFSTEMETYMGTLTLVQCSQPGSVDAWPVDHNLDGSITISDILALKPVFNQPVPPVSPRWDLNGSGNISISDVLGHKPFFARSCIPS